MDAQQVYTAITAEIRRKLIERQEFCPACFGAGWVTDPSGNPAKCRECEGSGLKYIF